MMPTEPLIETPTYYFSSQNYSELFNAKTTTAAEARESTITQASGWMKSLESTDRISV